MGSVRLGALGCPHRRGLHWSSLVLYLHQREEAGDRAAGPSQPLLLAATQAPPSTASAPLGTPVLRLGNLLVSQALDGEPHFPDAQTEI